MNSDKENLFSNKDVTLIHEIDILLKKNKLIAEKKYKMKLQEFRKEAKKYLQKYHKKEVENKFDFTGLCNKKIQFKVPETLPSTRFYFNSDKTVYLNNPDTFCLQDLGYTYKNKFYNPKKGILTKEFEIKRQICLLSLKKWDQKILFNLYLKLKIKKISQENIFEKSLLLEKLCAFVDLPLEKILEIFCKEKNTDLNLKNFDILNYNLCDICWYFNCNQHIKTIKTRKISSKKTLKCSFCIENNIMEERSLENSNKKNLTKTELQFLKRLAPLFDNICLLTKFINTKYRKTYNCNFIDKIMEKNNFKLKKKLNKKILPFNDYTINDVKKAEVFCDHLGPCLNNLFCKCFLNKKFCSKRCNCEECDILLTPCKCTICDENCLCHINSISCSNCKCLDCNQKIFDPKQVKIKESTIAGLGLFADENINKDQYVIEYSGELIDFHTTETRGRVYEKSRTSFLFDVSMLCDKFDTTIDAMQIGNGSRFINHSDAPNVEAKSLIENTKHKILFFALRDIKKGEELFFSYNYDEVHKQKFGM